MSPGEAPSLRHGLILGNWQSLSFLHFIYLHACVRACVCAGTVTPLSLLQGGMQGCHHWVFIVLPYEMKMHY